MINWVENILVMWGDYSQRKDDGGAGWSNASPTCRMAASSRAAGSMLIVESDALRADVIMSTVKCTRPELWAVAREWYVTGAPASTIASRVKCHRDTVYSRIAALHIIVANDWHKLNPARATANN